MNEIYEINSYTRLPCNKHTGDVGMKNKINISFNKLNKLKNFFYFIKINKYLYKEDKNKPIEKNEYTYDINTFLKLPRMAGKTKDSTRIVLLDDLMVDLTFEKVLEKFAGEFNLIEKNFIVSLNQKTRKGSTGDYEELVKQIFHNLNINNLEIITNGTGNTNNIDLIINYNNVKYYIEIKSVLSKHRIPFLWSGFNKFSNIKNISYDFNLNLEFYRRFSNWYYKVVSKSLFKEILNNYLKFLRIEHPKLYEKEVIKYQKDYYIKRQYISTNFAYYIKIFYPFIEENYKKIFVEYIKENFNIDNYYIMLFKRGLKPEITDVINGKELFKKLSFERDHQQYKNIITLKPVFYDLY